MHSLQNLYSFHDLTLFSYAERSCSLGIRSQPEWLLEGDRGRRRNVLAPGYELKRSNVSICNILT